MSSSGLEAQPLRTVGSFNWIYLIEWIVIGILTIFFLFYFNRIIATCLSYAVRLYTWKALGIYIDIEALQISPLAGRIFFKGVRYHGDNETIFVHQGYLTWRYWLPWTKKCGLFLPRGSGPESDVRSSTSSSSSSTDPNNVGEEEKGDSGVSQDNLPYRLTVKVSGVEAFLYNRSPAYDFILQNIAKRQAATGGGDGEVSANTVEKVVSDSPSSQKRQSPFRNPGEASSGDTSPGLFSDNKDHKAKTRTSSPPNPPAILRLFPVLVECNKGGIVLGNDNTAAIITTKFDSAWGVFDAARSGPLDIFKIVMNFDASGLLLQMKPNADYKQSQSSEAAELKAEDVELDNDQQPSKPSLGHRWRFLSRLRWMGRLHIPNLFSRSTDSIAGGSNTGEKLPLPGNGLEGYGEQRWLGLSRYLKDDQQDEHEEWAPIEYAKASTIADIPGVQLKFYWDIPGRAPPYDSQAERSEDDLKDEINGQQSPEYGMDLIVRGGQVNYGPWADRHRLNLQEIFFPPQYVDNIPESPLKPGDLRLNNIFKLVLTLEDDLILRIPFRESSKDYQWKGRAKTVAGDKKKTAEKPKHKEKSKKDGHHGKRRQKSALSGDLRPFAWFDIKVGTNTTINYIGDLYARKSGYHNTLKLDVSTVEMFSSLNHALLWRSGRVTMDASLPYPLAWNGVREWPFDIYINRLDLFLLRDHTFLLMDMIEDWTSGPLPDYYTFVPYRYIINPHFTHFKLFCNTNQANIIDNPEDIDDNHFVILYGGSLDATLTIPLDNYRPVTSDLTFDVVSRELGFEMSMPSKNTVHTLLENKNVAFLDSVLLKGSYTYFGEVKPGLCETLCMEITGNSLTLSMFGFLACHLARLKENYFGEEVHFRTTEEYQQLLQQLAAGHIPEIPPIKSNDLDVILKITANDVSILLPSALYSCEEYVKGRVDITNVDLRVTNYYLELMVNSSPLELSYAAKTLQGTQTEIQNSNPQLSIDGVKCFGHRLFGDPPKEPAYVSNWDVDSGDITGECNGKFIEKLVGAAMGFAFTFMDKENSVPVSHTVPLHDVTFVRFGCPLIRLWCHAGSDTAFCLSTGFISGSFNDWAGKLFSQRLRMSIPDICLTCIDADSARKNRRSKKQKPVTHAYFETSVSFNMIQRSPHFEREQQLQQLHIRTQDKRTLRSPMLLNQQSIISNAIHTRSSEKEKPVSLSLPPLPLSLTYGQSPYDDASSLHSSSRADSLNNKQPNGLDPVIMLPMLYKAMTTSDARSSRASISSNSNSISSSIGHRAAGRNSVAASPSTRAKNTTASQAGRSSKDKQESGVFSSTPRSHVMYSSPYKTPNFRLNDVSADTSEVPIAPVVSQSSVQYRGGLMYRQGSFPAHAVDEDALQTSFIVSLEPGISLLCKPKAIQAVATLLAQALPADPVNMFDAFQEDVIGEVVANYMRKHGNKTVVDFKIKVPWFHVRFINTLVLENEASHGTLDKYNLVGNSISVAARIKALPDQKAIGNSTSLHASVGSLKVSAEESSEVSLKDDVAFQAVVDDLLIWLVDSEKLSIHATFRAVEAGMASRKLEYIARLIHRTTLLADDLQSRFIKTFNQHELRLHYLIYELAVHSEELPDPPYLLLPTYAVRSGAEHIRNDDSWKILSRLRYSLKQLPETRKRDIWSKLECKSLMLPSDAESRVLASFDQWRNWDTIEPRESFAFRMLYRSSPDIEALDDRSRIPVNVALRSSGFKLVIDPGEHQTAFELEDLAMGLSITPPPPPSAMNFFQEYEETRSTVLQVNLADMSLTIDWQICDLADHLLTLFEQSPPTQTQQQEQENERSRSQAPTEPALPEKFHIVLTSDSGSIKIKSINLAHTISTSSMRISVTGHGWNAPEGGLAVNTLVSSKTIQLQLKSSESPIIKSEISSPSLWIAYEKPHVLSTQPESLKMVGDSERLFFEITEEIIGLVEIANLVIDDEVTHIRKLARKHENTNLQPLMSRSPSKHSAKNVSSSQLQIHAALFLDVYSIDVAILNDLRYSTTGRVARLAIRPGIQRENSFEIDYDLKSQSHRLLSLADGKAHRVSNIKMPPINGFVQIERQKSFANVSGALTVEKINIDGSAINGIVTILGTMQVTSAFEAIKGDATAVVSKLKEMFPASNISPKPKEKGTPITFDVSVALAGFAVTADAPARSRNSMAATLLFELRSLHAKVNNRGQELSTPLPFPQFRASLQEIAMKIQQVEDDTKHASGELSLGVLVTGSVGDETNGKIPRHFEMTVNGPRVNVYAETAPTVVEIIGHMQNRIRGLDLSREKKYLRRLGHLDRRKSSGILAWTVQADSDDEGVTGSEGSKFDSSLLFYMHTISVSYVVGRSVSSPVSPESENLVLSLDAITLRAQSESYARLIISSLQLGLVPANSKNDGRPRNSALLPQVVFNVTNKSVSGYRDLVFHAGGEALDIQLDPHFILPVSDLRRSIEKSIKHFKVSMKELSLAPSSESISKPKPFGPTKFSSLLVSANFAGAILRLQGRTEEDARRPTLAALHLESVPQHGRYGQFAGEGAIVGASLRSPSIALKMLYKDESKHSSMLNVEVRIDSSSNTLNPAIVPLIVHVSDSFKKAARESERDTETETPQGRPIQRILDEETMKQTDPRAVLGKMRLNVGIRICKQEFALTCQPIAKVAARTKLEDIYITVNSVESNDHGHFFAVAANITGLNASLKHMYSREPTFSFNIESIVLSLMNSKHLSGKTGISAILKINPSRTSVNAKQLQDVLLFREIWWPPEMRHASRAANTAPTADQQDYFVQRYQQIAATTRFPWNASVTLEKLSIDLDLGQGIGKLSFQVANFWASSKKSSSSQSDLCIGVDTIGISGSGRLSGYVDLEKVKVRTSIVWAPPEEGNTRTPLVQASIGFDELRVKAAFDYQAFATAYVTSFEFIMYNVRDERRGIGDRLVAILDGDNVHVYCIAATAGLVLSLVQAFERLIQEKQASYDQSLKEIERFLRRKSSVFAGRVPPKPTRVAKRQANAKSKLPISLHTDVVVTLRGLNVGAFPSTLLDHQILKGEASDVQARFAVSLENDRIHSALGLTLGKLLVALAGVPQKTMPKTLGDITIEDVLQNSAAAKGGVILRVPKVLAAMQTWQGQESRDIDYLFRSSFEGKIDVGWNYSRISFIRTMWATHTRTLAARLGKPLPESAVRIKGDLKPPKDPKAGDNEPDTPEEQQKITAVVNLPQSKYVYTALEPPVIETPQLRDMGEATPPLEWIGLHRDRLPNVTHQIVIVTLLEIAKEVEDAYSRILGSA